MKKYNYTIPAADANSAYLLYEVKDAGTGEIIISFYTNRVREGSFYYDEHEHVYKQTKGTCDFDMPISRDAARAKLRRMADATED